MNSTGVNKQYPPIRGQPRPGMQLISSQKLNKINAKIDSIAKRITIKSNIFLIVRFMLLMYDKNIVIGLK